MTFQQQLFDAARDYTNNLVLNGEATATKPGSVKHWLKGSEPSDQAYSIKFGKVGEALAQWFIEQSPNSVELLSCGVKKMSSGKKKDFDLLWRDTSTNTIYLRELKGNIELDSEKLPATFSKMRGELQPELEKLYPGATIDVGILNWSIFTRDQLTKGLSHIKKCEGAGVPVEHMSEFTKRLNIPLTQECWHELGRTLGAQTWPRKSPKSHTLQEQLLQQQEYIKQLEAQLAAKK
jgi:hypothetical protein